MTQLEYMKVQFAFHQTQALYWQTMAVTGVATTRGIARGRPPTEEEKVRGEFLPMEELTDAEKIQNAVETMHRHVQIMLEIMDAMGAYVVVG